MLRNQIIDINYARISTNSTNQLSSLTNQYKQFDKKNSVIFHIGSGRDTFPDNLKNTIIEHRKNNKDVRINVISFDRLTRNFIDVQFLYDNVRYINILSENQIYDMKIDMLIIVNKIVKSVEELEIIRNRCFRKKNMVKNIKQIKNNKIDNIKRQNLVFNNMLCLNVPKEKLEILKQIIQISQNLKNYNDWNKMYKLMAKLNFNVSKIKENYAKYNKTIQIYRLLKKDLMEYILEYFLNNNYVSNNKFILNFVNAYIK